MAFVERSKMLTFLAVPGESTSTFHLVWGASDLSWENNIVTDEFQDVHESAGRTSIIGRSPSISTDLRIISGVGARGKELSDYLQSLDEDGSTYAGAETEVLKVKCWEPGTTEGTFRASKFECALGVSTLGGGSDSPLSTTVDIYCNGSPVQGTVALTKADNGDLTAVFTADEATP